MNLLVSPLLQIAIDLISEFIRGINQLTIERQRNKRWQTETEEKLSNCERLSDRHSKVLPECPEILNIKSLTINNGRQDAYAHWILSSHCLL
jgi:hypothetical protein